MLRFAAGANCAAPTSAGDGRRADGHGSPPAASRVPTLPIAAMAVSLAERIGRRIVALVRAVSPLGGEDRPG